MNKARELLLQNFDQMVEVLQKTICFNTEKGAPVADGPFGLEIKSAWTTFCKCPKTWALKW